MYQELTLVGNVGRDPETRYTPSGDAMTTFSVATNRRWKDAAGQQQEKTTWFRVTTFGRLAETVQQYVGKGMAVLVVGEVQASSWVGRDGVAKASLDVRAREVRFLGRKDSERDDGSPSDDVPF